MAASVSRPLRKFGQFLKNMWDKEPIIVVSVVFGTIGIGTMFSSPITYKQEEEMRNWPSVYNFYNLPTDHDRIYIPIPMGADPPVWRTDYDD